MARKVKYAEDTSRKISAHLSFESPTYGEVIPVGSVVKYQDGSTYKITENGPRRIKIR